MARCDFIKSDGTQCGAYAMKNSTRCFFHSSAVNKSRNITLEQTVTDEMRKEMGQAVIGRHSSHGFSYEKLFGKTIGERPRVDKLQELEKFYDDGGLIARAIDSYVAVSIANGYQLIDTETGERETENTKIIEELDARINFHECFKKIFLSLLVYGFVWGEIDIPPNSKKMEQIKFLPPYELDIVRDKITGEFIEVRQVRGREDPIVWEKEEETGTKDVKNILYIPASLKHSETYGKGLLERVYSEAKSWKEKGKDIEAVTKFISYPFRVVKIGTDTYPASKEAVDKVGDEVENLEPGDWFVTRHNIEFEFHAPDVPEALIANYREETRQLIVSLGVPSLYTALENIDANTLKEIRSIFNSTVEVMQTTVKTYFEDQVIKRQFELLDKLKKRTDKPPVSLIWNPLTVSVLSILELTQLVMGGVVGIEEARRILESMGYGLLRGERWKEEVLEQLPSPKAPKESHPTDEEPQKSPIKPPTQAPDKPPTKEPTEQPRIKRPQPNAPKMTFEQWLAGLALLKDIDKFKAYSMLSKALENGFNETEPVIETIEEEKVPETPSIEPPRSSIDIFVKTEPLQVEPLQVEPFQQEPVDVNINVTRENPPEKDTSKEDELLKKKMESENQKQELYEKIKKKLGDVDDE